MSLLQGALPDGPDFLVTLPIARWATAVFDYDGTRTDVEVLPATKTKARQVAEAVLARQGGGGGVLRLAGSLPEGKGLARLLGGPGGHRPGGRQRGRTGDAARAGRGPAPPGRADRRGDVPRHGRVRAPQRGVPRPAGRGPADDGRRDRRGRDRRHGGVQRDPEELHRRRAARVRRPADRDSPRPSPPGTLPRSAG
ncbi:hypothetical protein [Nocardioides convexus]|uniref:hypothetical protein n=1 Tax=Nocardioides convexus TaxID=2712224 RepID=UPI002418A7AD|nr:hypothetical protein [Nocardioides convexus]